MARFYTDEQAEAAVREALAAGPLTHNELVSALETSGHGKAAEHLIHLATNGKIAASVKVTGVPGQPPVLRYSLPEGS